MDPSGVLHVGAHTGEEALEYELHGWLPVSWIEAQSKLCIDLIKKLDPNNHQVIHAAVWEKSGITLEFNVSSNGQSSSILEFGTHASNYPDNVVLEKQIIETSTLADLDLDFTKIDFINLDIQGVELQALRGLGEKIASIKWIYTEVNREDVYQNCTKIDELDLFLRECGFKRVATRWCLGVGWGDALYARSGLSYRTNQRISQAMNYLKWYYTQIPRLPIRAIRRRIRMRALKTNG